jgi:5-methylcytosine-specific restriction endonuclease McrA
MKNNPMSDKTGPDHHNWKENKPDHRFYQTEAWKEVRQEALEQANGACEACRSEEDLVGHHVVPLSAGGEPLDVENVSILCRTCHMEWEGLFLSPDRRE